MIDDLVQYLLEDGWIFPTSLNNVMKKEKFLLEFWEERNILTINEGSWYSDDRKYKGIIPTIDDFKIVCKLIGI